jgi:hypothetical protein
VLVDTASAAAGDPTVAYVQGNYGGLTAKVTTGSLVYVLAVPSIVTSSGTSIDGILNVTSLSGTLLFYGKPLKNGGSFVPGAVVFSGARLPASSTEIALMMTNLKAAYSGTDIATERSVATVLAADASTLSSLGTSLVTNQLG